MNKRNVLIFIFLFFLKIFVVKCTDDPENDGRYYNNTSFFNQEYLNLVKEYLKENKNERFYLFDVSELNLNYEYEVEEGGVKAKKTEKKKIYTGSLTFNNSNIVGNNQDSTFAIFKDNFDNEDNSKYLQYCNTIPNGTRNKIIKEGNKYKIQSMYPDHKCGDINNNKTDKPIIFKITKNDDSTAMYFCSNIEFINLYNEKYGKNDYKNLSLFKNDKIKKVEIIEYFFSNNNKGYECDYLFYDCTNLEEINLDTNDKEIHLYGEGMFQNCTNLKKIIMTKIHNTNPKGYEFYKCTSLEELVLNKEFSLGICGCVNCTNLKIIKFVDDDGNPFKDSIFCDGLCFSNCENLENIEVESIITNVCTKKFYNNCKKLKIPKTIINLESERNIGFYNFDYMFFGVSKKYNDEITIQFNRSTKDDGYPDFNYNNVFKGCDVEKINIIVKELDGKEKKIENITENDKIKWFICFPDNYIKLRQLYQNTSDPKLITFLNANFDSNKSKKEIEKEYIDFKKQCEENNKLTDQKTKEVNVNKNLGTCRSCGLCFSKCCCCCIKNR